MRRFLLTLLLLGLSGTATAGLLDSVDRKVSAQSAYPLAVEPNKVGRYPAWVKSGAGHFFDDVLEYRVWLHPKWGAEKKNGNDVYYAAFAQYENALAFSKKSKGAEEPLVLIRQMVHVNEPTPGVFEVIEGERITEWQVQWLRGSKRGPDSIEKFMSEHRK